MSMADNLSVKHDCVWIVLYVRLSGVDADLLRALRDQLGLRARPRIDDVQACQLPAGGAPCSGVVSLRR